MVLRDAGPRLRLGVGFVANQTKMRFSTQALGCALFVAIILSAAAFSIRPSRAADDVPFVGLVTFTAKGMAQLAGSGTGSLSTTTDGKNFRMRLSNVAAGGATGKTELVTVARKSDLALESSVIYDVVKGAKEREMKRKKAKSVLDDKETDVFEYTEVKDGNVTRTEPYVEFKVVDFISVMLVAADAVHHSKKQPQDLSMLRDRSVRRVKLSIVGQETVDKRPATRFRVAPFDNPEGGIVYVIAKTADGKYYPALISAQTDQGLVELEGKPQ